MGLSVEGNDMAPITEITVLFNEKGGFVHSGVSLWCYFVKSLRI